MLCYPNSSLKVKRDNDERTPQIVRPPRGLPSGQIVRPGACEGINEVPLMKWDLNLEVTTSRSPLLLTFHNTIKFTP